MSDAFNLTSFCDAAATDAAAAVCALKDGGRSVDLSGGACGFGVNFLLHCRTYRIARDAFDLSFDEFHPLETQLPGMSETCSR
eukprot:scaffold2357_cov167-Amphora_coffeaeformis.AAC.15